MGVDIDPQPRYPYEFIQADALAALRGEIDGVDLDAFDVIHASPPCQSYSKAFKHMAKPQPMLIDPVRDLLIQLGKPWIIENVEGAPLGRQDDLFGGYGSMCCGTAFGMRVYRHRLFESSHPLIGAPCQHNGRAMNPHNSVARQAMYREFGREAMHRKFGRDAAEKVWAEEMGVSWMSRHGARESIPPAFTEWLGKQLMDVAKGVAT